MLTHWAGSNNGKTCNTNNRRGDVNNNNQNQDGGNGGLSFMQCQPVAGTNRVLRADIQCFHCNQYGHFRNVWANNSGDGTCEYQFTQVFMTFYEISQCGGFSA